MSASEWYLEVYATKDGIDLGGVDIPQVNPATLSGADDYVEELRQTVDGRVEVFTLPHYHGQDAEECSCVEWLSDHRPYAVIDNGVRL